MAIRDEDFGADLTLVEGDDGIWSSSEAAPTCAPCDLRSLYERERARADAAEALCEELRWAEVDARARASSLKWQLDKSRSKLSEAAEETKEVRRAAKDVLSLPAEVTRLEKLLSEAGVEPSKRGRISSVREERRRLRAAFEQAENQKDKIKTLRTERGELRKQVTRLNREVVRLNKRLEREARTSESQRDTIRRQYDDGVELRAQLRMYRDQADTVRSLSDEVFWLRLALEGSEARKGALKAKLAKLLADKKMLSKPIAGTQLRAALRRLRHQKKTITSQSREIRRLRRAVRASERLKVQVSKHRAAAETLSKSLSDQAAQLRNALRRSRRQKTAIKSLSRENARLRKAAKTSRSRIETLEAQLARLRATGAVLSKALFGRKSEQQERPRSERPRGQQPGAAGHGRTQRPGLEERTEELNPPEDARVCSCCGQPYAPNGAEESTIVEIEVRAHTRRIVRPRWRRSCDCASSPLEVSAPPVPRLFDNTLYGISVWACFLFERYGCDHVTLCVPFVRSPAGGEC